MSCPEMFHVKVHHDTNLVIKTSNHSVKKTTEKKENFVVKCKILFKFYKI